MDDTATPSADCAVTEKSSREQTELPSEEFAYIERTQFTSEAFKIEIGNIPKFFGFAECKKLLKNTLKLNPHKIKHVPRVKKIYVTFKNEKDKNEALEKLNQYEYKHCILAVKNAKPKADAMAVKRENTMEKSSETDEKKMKLGQSDEELKSSKEMLVQSVTRWHNIPYDQQLTKKFLNMKDVLVKLRLKMGKINLDNEVFVWTMKHKNEAEGMCCPLRPVLPSPVTESYRNKSEFTVGIDTGGERVVGYRLGKYRDQTCAVERADAISVLPEKMKLVASKFEEFVKTSDKEPYNPQNYEGHWRQLTVRTSIDCQVMAIVIVCDKDQDEDDIRQEKKSIEDFFKSDENHLVSTLLYQLVPTHRESGREIEPPSVLFGAGHITESLMGLQFQISPDAFFQCNTLAADVLYSAIKVLLKTDSSDETNDEENEKSQNTEKQVILFDICCGTGTIGLTLASSVMKVIGIEYCQQAVQDAKKNADINGIKNAEFYCGKAEDLLPNIIKNYSSSSSYEIVAVLDPPRPGIHSKVIQALRRCPALKKIIYVSCNPNACLNNFFDLCRPMSKRMPGLPFLPLVAQPVDLFPQTPHCELIVVFKRVNGVKVKEDVTDMVEPEILVKLEENTAKK